ncbi:hypothetical protein MTO98_16440 [Mucilaginibacter sp. SMC90]|uniref:hypothetical protein n=1 Tax=Mucilaginibacter sp. SMC90 TaxID=2929803 RepID=UPI001FB264D7|nr:hypothetical protein [Mucilaginibacter sp. SMC90]UOE52660.1 hypothetical protein MTO98_16440 [Mucilaginibacter sp. SMC90]
MEFDENKEEEKYSEDDYVDIYSKRAIFWFSFFNLIFGGVLLIINLYNAGYKRAVPAVLAFVLFFSYLSYFVILHSGVNLQLVVDAMNLTAKGGQPTPAQVTAMLSVAGLNVGFGLVGALILSQFFFKRYFPDNDYYPKPVGLPILIFIVLVVITRIL